ncbi:hypothetical protein [Algiphilus sp.]|uniref:hypothetical protein n=1 Tax=Algiphilus sp. TaxID=1872431 RepID=UPI002A6444AB|nr:hypothetical protein [Pseudomonadota bacterium]
MSIDPSDAAAKATAPVRFRLQPIYRLGIAALSGSVAIGSSGAALAAVHSTAPELAVQLAQAEGSATKAMAEGEGEGEGEGGKASILRDDSLYLARLGLIRGHLTIGVDLYRNGHREAAATHMKHPADELYAGLKPALDVRGAPGFAEALQQLAEQVEAGAEIAAVEEAFAAVEAGLEAAASAVPKTQRTDAEIRFGVIIQLLRTAAQEYAVALDDGQVVHAHEYQDALGFVRVARAELDALRADDKQMQRAGVAAAVEVARTQLDGIADLWIDLMPPAQLDRDPGRLFGATARIELAASAIQ